MTVGELVAKLKDLSPNMPVVVSVGDGESRDIEVNVTYPLELNACGPGHHALLGIYDIPKEENVVVTAAIIEVDTGEELPYDLPTKTPTP